ncbi:hypothetical protein GNF18_03215 [Ligilactobacillus pobuzihii]|uniref:hypothetical protein n=1 Tax=Ligilactobacillus pobuzihii TaxID=449659 RepID=UPI0019D2AA2B|nr:hypothetical protein [Ligilactobacillus pobuzihii]MBN7274172.1 hypothetical protein [Ligilactobacillus pobuzihii]
MDITDLVGAYQKFDAIYRSIKKIKQTTDEFNSTYNRLDKAQQVVLTNKIM